MTHELAAGQLGCPVGTVRSRLSRGRAELLRRITRRGLTLSAAGLVSALEANARAAAVPPILRIALIRLATGWGSATAARVGGLGTSASVATLLEGVLNVMRIKKVRDHGRRVGGRWVIGSCDRGSRAGCWWISISRKRHPQTLIRPFDQLGRTAGPLEHCAASGHRTLNQNLLRRRHPRSAR